MSAAEEERRALSAEWLSKRGGLGKWLVLTLARRHTGMALQELGDQMGGYGLLGRKRRAEAV